MAGLEANCTDVVIAVRTTGARTGKEADEGQFTNLKNRIFKHTDQDDFEYTVRSWVEAYGNSSDDNANELISGQSDRQQIDKKFRNLIATWRLSKEPVGVDICTFLVNAREALDHKDITTFLHLEEMDKLVNNRAAVREALAKATKIKEEKDALKKEKYWKQQKRKTEKDMMRREKRPRIGGISGAPAKKKKKSPPWSKLNLVTILDYINKEDGTYTGEMVFGAGNIEPADGNTKVRRRYKVLLGHTLRNVVETLQANGEASLCFDEPEVCRAIFNDLGCPTFRRLQDGSWTCQRREKFRLVLSPPHQLVAE